MKTGQSTRFLRHVIGPALLALCLPAGAEDIDLFVQPSPSEGGVPNVLIILDNTANWNTPFANEMAALLESVDNLPFNADFSAKFRVGLMLFTETGNPNNNVDGGYVRAAVRDLTLPYKGTFMGLLENLDRLNDVSNGGKAGKTMAEAYYYFDGAPPLSGNNKVKTDFTGNSLSEGPKMTAAGAAAANAIYATPGNALPNGGANPMAGTPYNSPVDPDGCAANFIIYISNGKAQDNDNDTSTATTLLQAAAAAEGISGATTTIPISPTGSMDNVADEWARFMRRSPHAITTYTVDVDPIDNNTGRGWSALLKSMAAASNGQYFAVSSGNGGEQIAFAMNTIFSQIQAVNSVFASVSLPLSVSSQGTYLNQIYVGMFRPNQDGLPRWTGNLKQYRLGVVNNRLVTVDADGSEAISPGTGFIAECARSYWTTADNYWAFSPQSDCIGANPASNSPDGNITEKGAQGQRLRSTTTRNVQTCTAFSCPGGLVNFNATNLTGSNAGANISTDSTERQRFINYQRGRDVNDEDIDAVTTLEMRPSAHGDVVHSRPVAINYGTNIAPQIVVFYGGNDGVLRAINGNRSTAIGTVGAGSELWSFVAPEFFPHIRRLHNNNVQVSYESNPTLDPLPQPKPYGLDGAVTAYNSASAKWLYVGARRGGRVVYAFDVTTLNTDPGSTELLWKIGCPTNLPDTDDPAYVPGGYPDGIDDGCTSGFDDLGQTWSAPKLLETLGYTESGSPAPMLIMGGGYDPCEDEDPINDTCRSSSKGSKVYVMNAETGELLTDFDTDRGVAADVFVVPEFIKNSAGEIVQVLAKYAYVVDLGGNIYRISGETANEPFGTAHPEDWTMTKIASLGCTSTALCTPNRKFMFMPDVVEQPEPGSGTFHVLVGSGDREKPLLAFDSAASVTNYFFMVKDNPTDPEWLVDSCGVSDVICISSLTPITSNATPDPDDLADSKGWYLGLHDNEQVVTSAITVFGTTTFSTHTPLPWAENSCEGNLGDARVYNIGYLNAVSRNGTQNRWEDVSGDGLPPSPVAGLVLLDGSTTPIPFIIGADPDSPLQGAEPTPPSSGTQPKSLTYWYIEQ